MLTTINIQAMNLLCFIVCKNNENLCMPQKLGTDYTNFTDLANENINYNHVNPRNPRLNIIKSYLTKSMRGFQERCTSDLFPEYRMLHTMR